WVAYRSRTKNVQSAKRLMMDLVELSRKRLRVRVVPRRACLIIMPDLYTICGRKTANRRIASIARPATGSRGWRAATAVAVRRDRDRRGRTVSDRVGPSRAAEIPASPHQARGPAGHRRCRDVG